MIYLSHHMIDNIKTGEIEALEQNYKTALMARQENAINGFEL